MKRLMIAVVALTATVAGVALAADAKAGGDIFNKSCKGCHGAEGAAPNEAVGKMLGAPIPTLASKDFQAAKSDADIRTAITAGHGKMPPVKSVTGAQVDDVIAYVRSLKK